MLYFEFQRASSHGLFAGLLIHSRTPREVRPHYKGPSGCGSPRYRSPPNPAPRLLRTRRSTCRRMSGSTRSTRLLTRPQGSSTCRGSRRQRRGAMNARTDSEFAGAEGGRYGGSRSRSPRLHPGVIQEDVARSFPSASSSLGFHDLVTSSGVAGPSK